MITTVSANSAKPLAAGPAHVTPPVLMLEHRPKAGRSQSITNAVTVTISIATQNRASHRHSVLMQCSCHRAARVRANCRQALGLPR